MQQQHIGRIAISSRSEAYNGRAAGGRRLGLSEGPGSTRSSAGLTPAWDEERFLEYTVCKGYCNQLSAFLDGIGVAYLLNITAVLPEWYTNYLTDTTGRGRYDRTAQQAYAVPMGYFWDVDHLIDQLKGRVSIVHQLPDELRKDDALYMMPQAIDAAVAGGLGTYRKLLREQRVLRLACKINVIQWNTPALGALRASVLAALRPSAELSAAVEERRAYATSVLQPYGLDLRPGQYISMHLRNEQDWRAYCEQEPKQWERTWIESFSKCYYGPERAGAELKRIMGRRQPGSASGTAAAAAAASEPAQVPRVLYVGSGNLTVEGAQALMSAAGFLAVANEQVICVRGNSSDAAPPTCSATTSPIADKRELRAAVDLQLLLGGGLFIGNIFSSLSFTVRMLKYVRRDPLTAPNDALYYNERPSHVALDVNPVEARRHGLFGGMLRRRMYGSGALRFSQLAALHKAGKCLHVYRWGPECAADADGEAGAALGAAAAARKQQQQQQGEQGEQQQRAGEAGGSLLPEAGLWALAKVDRVVVLGVRALKNSIQVVGRIQTSVPRFYPMLVLKVDGQDAGEAVASRYPRVKGSQLQPEYRFQVHVAPPPSGNGTAGAVLVQVCSTANQVVGEAETCSPSVRVALAAA